MPPASAIVSSGPPKPAIVLSAPGSLGRTATGSAPGGSAEVIRLAQQGRQHGGRRCRQCRPLPPAGATSALRCDHGWVPAAGCLGCPSCLVLCPVPGHSLNLTAHQTGQAVTGAVTAQAGQGGVGRSNIKLSCRQIVQGIAWMSSSNLEGGIRYASDSIRSRGQGRAGQGQPWRRWSCRWC